LDIAMAALLPGADVLAAWATMDEVLEWSGLPANAWRAMARQLGDPELQELIVVASIDADSVMQAMSQARLEGVSLSAVHKAKVMLTINAVRGRFGLQLLAPPGATMAREAPLSGDVSGLISSAALTAALAPHVPATKVKLAQVIDQALDVEVPMMSADEITTARRRFLLSEGDAPLETEEITDMQLSALKAKITILRAAPFVDMGVWGPHGDRRARAMRFTATRAGPNGTTVTIELPGAPNITEWMAAWRVFRTGMIMLAASPSAVLDRYAAEFQRRVSDYPGCWALAAQADVRMRTEWWMAELRRQMAFHAEHPAMAAFVPEQPWANVIKASAAAGDFWDREYEKPALRVTCQAPTAAAFSAGSAPVPRRELPPPRRHPSPRRNQRSDGRYTRSHNDVEICFSWARNKDGCETVCPASRAHVCEWCLQPHRTVHHKGPTGNEAGKGSSGKGKGGARRSGKRKHM